MQSTYFTGIVLGEVFVHAHSVLQVLLTLSC